jgi:uncharacterized protein
VTYDPTKSLRNDEDRGLPFALAEDFDWSGALIVEDTREDYRERRYQALGFIGEPLHMLVFTPRGSAIHVVSLHPRPRESPRKDPICHANPTLS